jgi:hypothetical protein
MNIISMMNYCTPCNIHLVDLDLIRSDAFPRLPRDVTTVETVKQGVGTSTRRLLGRNP